LEKYTKHADVKNVLCVMSPLSGAPRLIPIGKGLEYQDVNEAMSDFGDTASEVFVVDANASSGSKISRVVESGKARKQEITDAGVSGAGEASVAAQVSELQAKLEQAEAKIRELEHLSELKDALDQHESNLASREQSLVRMEDELMDRMNQYMEQLAELEQREDNLAERESRACENRNSA
jgi:TolA-binding protein